jgi:hypothetical protein
MFPIKVKAVEPTNWREILLLPSTLSRQTLERARQATRFLWDLEAFTEATNKTLEQLEVDFLKLQKTGFTAEEEQAMMANISPLIGTPRGSVYGFKIPELLKERCRPVWACHINDDMSTEGYSLHTQPQIWRLMQDATRVVMFDGKSMYDQFPLEGETRNFFAFRLRDGTPANLSNLPMGFGPACEIAQLMSLILASFELENNDFRCVPVIHIDNFAFLIIPRTAVVSGAALEIFTSAVIKEFFIRCRRTNFQLNEATKAEMDFFTQQSAQEQQRLQAQWCPDEFVLLGVQYEMRSRVRSNAPKTLKKLEAIRNILFPNGTIVRNTTPRQLAVAFGVGRWAARSIGLKHVYYSLFTAAANLGNLMHSNPNQWDSPLSVTSQFAELSAWYDVLLQNHPTRIWHLPKENTPVLIVDASHLGWGGVHVHNNQVSTVSGAWTEPIESSVQSEPEGTLAAIKEVGCGEELTIVTDHQPLVYAALSQQARGWFYFRLLSQLTVLWPRCHFNFVFVEGEYNPADALSRGRPMERSAEYCRAMAAAAGMGASMALLNPSREVPSLLVLTATA